MSKLALMVCVVVALCAALMLGLSADAQKSKDSSDAASGESTEKAAKPERPPMPTDLAQGIEAIANPDWDGEDEGEPAWFYAVDVSDLFPAKENWKIRKPILTASKLLGLDKHEYQAPIDKFGSQDLDSRTYLDWSEDRRKSFLEDYFVLDRYMLSDVLSPNSESRANVIIVDDLD